MIIFVGILSVLSALSGIGYMFAEGFLTGAASKSDDYYRRAVDARDTFRTVFIIFLSLSIAGDIIYWVLK